ncbi:DUF4381 domain-containing protein [Vibrio sp. TBV020]|uniref:DUF4381 domain-containing protein n=1 Tax=Vibrio sp. TBV020 TaxID=3137398 RepID=UPI0038CD11F1
MGIEHTPPSTYILRELNDVTVPHSVSWFPQTIGWKVLGIIFLLALLYLGYLYVHSCWVNRYRNEALRAIENLDIESEAMPHELFSIVKIVMTYLGASNAKLYGDDFLKEVEAYGDGEVMFTDPLGKLWMKSLIVPMTPLSTKQRQTLLVKAKSWVKCHTLNAEQSNDR